MFLYLWPLEVLLSLKGDGSALCLKCKCTETFVAYFKHWYNLSCMITLSGSYSINCNQVSCCEQWGNHQSRLLLPSWTEDKGWRLVANIILMRSAEGHEKMSVMIPHCELICSIQLICGVLAEDQGSSLSVGTHLSSWSALEQSNISSSTRQAMTYDPCGVKTGCSFITREQSVTSWLA